MVAFPPPLKKGGTIGIVAPACHGCPAWTDKGKALLEKRGYRVVVHPQHKLRSGQLGGSDKARAGALMDMFADPSIDAIICARGGNGAIRIIDKLDYKLIKRNPKPFVGFSDITLLLNAITRQCGFVTYHGPMMWNFAHPHNPRTVTDMLAVLGTGAKENWSQAFKVVGARSGAAEGVLVGGNIALLQSLIATPNDWSAKGAILFLEDTEEPFYRVDRMIRHMKHAGKFEGVRAVMVGEMTDMTDGESGIVGKDQKPYGHSLRQIFTEVLPPDVPLCFNFPCGHGKYLTTFPVGAKVRLKIKSASAQLSFTRS